MKKSVYKGVLLPMALYGAETWGMRSAERIIVNVLKIIFLRSMVGVIRMYRVTNEQLGQKERWWVEWIMEC